MIRLIVATDPNGVIGVKYKHTEDGSPPVGDSYLPKEGQPRRNWTYRWKMPWHYKQDLQRFKKLTMGGVLVMGRRTFESLPGVLPGRCHLLLTRDEGFFQNNILMKHPDQVDYFNSFEELTHRLEHDYEGHNIWVAGGAEIYHLFLKAGAVREIDHTVVPEVDLDNVEHLTKTVRFDLDKALEGFELVSEEVNPLDHRLTHRRYRCPLLAYN